MLKNKITIKDVALACGVSQTSVSLVLNNRKNNISEKTKKLIKSVANELGYIPNHSARSLATNKTNTIGIVIPDLSNTFFAEAVRVIQIELHKYGYDSLLCNSEEKYENDLKYIRLLSNRNVDGLIFTMSAESMISKNQENIKKILKQMTIPYILFDRYYNGDDSKVYVDNFQSGFEMVDFLINHGHQKIGFITGPMNLNSSIGRLEGAKKAFHDNNLIFDDSLIFHGKYDVDSGREGAKSLLHKVSSIFAFNDLMALGVIDYAKQNSFNIPNDVSLAGFDDIIYSSMLDPSLTTMKQPIEKMSKKLCSLLIKKIENPNYHESISFKAKLIKRSSVLNKTENK